MRIVRPPLHLAIGLAALTVAAWLLVPPLAPSPPEIETRPVTPAAAKAPASSPAPEFIAPLPPPVLLADWPATVRRLLASADHDLPAALDWTYGFSVREERQRLQTALCLHLAERSPAAAADLAARLRLDEAEEDVVAGIVIRWSGADPAAALAWALAQTDDARRSRCLSPFVDRLVSVAPHEAAELVAEAMPPGPEQARATLAVVAAWAARDFSAALDWVSRLSDEDLRAAAIGALVSVDSPPAGFSPLAPDSKR